MESAITALIVFGMLILAIFGLSERSMAVQSQISDGTLAMETRLQSQARTGLGSVRGATDPTLGNWVDITLQNSGTTKIAQFTQWDVILQYTDAFGAPHLEYYPTSKWTYQLYATAPATPEFFEPGIFNPGEQMIVHVVPNFSIGTGTTNHAIVTTPNGIAASTVFTR